MTEVDTTLPIVRGKKPHKANEEEEEEEEAATTKTTEDDHGIPKKVFVHEETPGEHTPTETETETRAGGDDDDGNEQQPHNDPQRHVHVVASHYNELREAGRAERLKSRIFHMRNFNNWIKSLLIAEYIEKIRNAKSWRQGNPLNVLDMCCGKGGDLLKWEKANISYLICTDIAEVSVEQCKSRYQDMAARLSHSKYSKKFDAEFIACDSTLTQLRTQYKDKSMKLHLTSCQFAFHYSFESLSQADCMVKNAAECLETGGYFIATIPHANEIMRRLRASENGRSFGNEIYNIEFMCDSNPPPLFGAKYQFKLEGVVDCPEFLVHLPTLEKLCRKHGLLLERMTTFADYYKENTPKGIDLLQRMKGLESVNVQRCASDPEYSHIKNAPGNGAKFLGTLSKSEWEAITIYCVLAFRKCKWTSYDAEGKKIYDFNDQ